MNELHIKSQKDFDAIPDGYDGRIYIEFGTPYNRAVVNRAFRYSVEARGNSSVVARGNSSVVAWENSSVVAWENSSVVAWENSSVEARGNSSVEARENSSVVAWENSSVVAAGNSQITDRTGSHKLQVSGNARIVYDPSTPKEYCEYYGLHIDEESCTGRFFKAVRKEDDRYHANYNGLEYMIGETVEADCLDTDPNEDCGHGIHMAYKEWAVAFGKGWPNLAILELEADLDRLVVPGKGCGKVRAAKAKVIREVPLEECGLQGKILAKRRNRE